MRRMRAVRIERMMAINGKRYLVLGQVRKVLFHLHEIQ